jgi:hypothetical protein
MTDSEKGAYLVTFICAVVMTFMAYNVDKQIALLKGYEESTLVMVDQYRQLASESEKKKLEIFDKYNKVYKDFHQCEQAFQNAIIDYNRKVL